ncbi:MAG: 8-amino-7-oxononanoate synthase [Candidatus Eremiobacteraeota bacterium]|nr:8-amino-7-oxononanoate synthase [Candidatus Eremiobacteraeota bacterium]
MTYLDGVSQTLDRIRVEGRYRTLETHQLSGAIDFSSNDYLGLATNPQVLQAFRHATRVGSGGSRLLGGRHREHSLLEEELAAWLGRERALIFSSGYLAALGAIPVLGRMVKAIYSDALNHASLIDGVRMSHAERVVYPHAELPARSERIDGALIVTESIFSMDGDTVDVRALVEGMGRNDVLLVDEAHALGVAGPHGSGIASEIDDSRAVVMGTLSKAFGCQGGFVAGPAALIELLVNTARSFIFDTALPPAIALAARVALVQLRNGDEARKRLHENVQRTRDGLASLGFVVAGGPAPIVPVVLGAESRAVNVSKALMAKKLYVPAIRPPTVPPGTSRLRISLRADHISEQIDLLIEGIRECIATL